MPTLIDRNGVRADAWLLDREAALPAGRQPLAVPLAAWLEHGQALKASERELGVLLTGADEPGLLVADLDRLALVAVEFASFGDGRGFSSARLLRERHGYRGELRATGDVFRDQLQLLARVGFDSFALRDGEDPAAALAAFGTFSEAYQAAVDRRALFERRFAAGARRGG